MIEAEYHGVVYVVDDDTGIRRSLESLLGCVGVRTRLFSSAIDAHTALEEGPVPNCIVCDMRLPGMSGLEFLRAARSLDRLVPFIILTGYGDIATAVACMKDGAADFIEKPVRPQHLLDRIREVMIEASTQRRRGTRTAELAARYARLTAREGEVVDHVLRGDTSKAIAAKLGISPKTVHAHRAKATQKMDARSVAELAHLVDLARAGNRGSVC